MRSLALLMVLCATFTPVQADILHLRDGTRYQGELISQDDHEVVFRVLLGDGVSGVVRRFPAETVARISTEPLPPPPRDESDLDTTALPDWAYEQMVREAFELLDDGDPAAALRALQRAVRQVPKAELPQLETLCRTTRGLPLDELLARTRVLVAAEERDGQAFRIRFVTPYEQAAFGRLLTGYQMWLLNRTHAERTLTAWLAAPALDEITGLAARQLAADAGRTAAVCGARLSFDPGVRNDRNLRKALYDQRKELARLVSRLQSQPGFTASDSSSTTNTEPPDSFVIWLAEQDASRDTGAPARQDRSTPAAARGA